MTGLTSQSIDYQGRVVRLDSFSKVQDIGGFGIVIHLIVHTDYCTRMSIRLVYM